MHMVQSTTLQLLPLRYMSEQLATGGILMARCFRGRNNDDHK